MEIDESDMARAGVFETTIINAPSGEVDPIP
jgi:hypothetical protein